MIVKLEDTKNKTKERHGQGGKNKNWQNLWGKEIGTKIAISSVKYPNFSGRNTSN